MQKYEKNGISFDYEVVYKKQKNTYFRVRSNHLYITTNKHMGMKVLMQLIEKHLTFIVKRLNTQKSLHNYRETKNILLLGKEYAYVEAQTIKDEIIIKDNIMYCYYKKNAEKVVDKYYKELTNLKIKDIAEDVSEKTNLKCESITVKKLKSKWGSCGFHNKKIIINSALAYLDLTYLKYVMYHEFCHLKYPNHSKEYYDLLRMYIPNYLNIRKELRKYSLA